jgi:transcriptional regulator of acetoin/glycerol metabolism
LLRKYDWPGNVRQLFAALESAAISAGGRRIEAQHLPEAVRGGEQAASARYRTSGPVEDERQAIEDAIAHAGGSLSRAAELLGMGRTTLWRKLRAHGISTESDDGPSSAEGDDQ